MNVSHTAGSEPLARRRRMAWIAGRAALALTLLLGPSATPPQARAQPGTIHFELVETWPDRAPDYPVETLDWPAGHEAGGLGIAPDGTRIAVVDRTDAVLRTYDTAGRALAVLGEPGSGPGQLAAPRDVAILDDGRLAISDNGNDRVQLWSDVGAFERQWPVEDPLGIVWVGEPRSAGIYVVARAADGSSRVEGYSPEGQLIERFEVEIRADPSAAPTEPRPAIEQLAWVKTESINDRGTLRPVAGFLLAAPETGQVLMMQGPTVLPQLLLLDRSDPPRLSLPGLSAVASWEDPATGRRHGFAGAPGPGVMPLAGVLPEQADHIPLADLRDLEIAPDGVLFAAAGAGGPLRVGASPWLTPRLLGLGRLVGPRRLAAGEALHLADAWPRVQRWSLAGGPESSLQMALRGGGAVAAMDVAALDEQAWALSTDAILRRVTPTGLEGFWQTPNRPWTTAVALDAGRADGRPELGLLDLAGQAVLRLDEGFELAGRLDLTRPEAPFRELSDLALIGDHIAVADAEGGAVELYGRDGTLQRRMPVPGGPSRVTAGPEGSILALAPTGWAFAFAPDGRARGAWPMDAGGPPRDLALGADGRLYAAGPDEALRVYARRDALGPGQPPEPRGGCDLAGDKTAAPAEILLGQTVTVTLTIGGRCRSEERAADVLLLIDTSGSMGEGRKHVAAKNAAVSFMARMGGSDARVAVVDFNSTSTLRQPLGRDRAGAARAIGELVIGGGTDIVGALRTALAALAADPPQPGRGEVSRALVLLSDGRSDDTGLDAVLAGLAAEGIEIYTIGLGADVDPAMLERIAGAPERSFLSPGIDRLQQLYDEIGRRILEPEPLAEQELVDRLPANMRYRPGSASPSEPRVSPDGRSLTWTDLDLPASGWRVRYQVEPMAAGLWPTNREAYLDYRDGLGEPGRYDFPVPRVRVHAPERGRVHLPLVLRESCPPRSRPNDIVLLLDASGSMRAPAADGRSKLEAAVEAARGFLEPIELGRDRVAVAAFNEEARLLAGLGDDRARIEAALAAIESRPGTRIASGIDLAAEVLRAARPEAGRTLLLLTDGRSSDPEPGAAELSAAAARDAGITIFAIGLGPDVDADALRAIASSPALYHHAPDPGTLAAIYRQIAITLPCPPASLWPFPRAGRARPEAGRRDAARNPGSSPAPGQATAPLIWR